MRYLLFSMVIACGCASDYKALSRISIDETCYRSSKPKPLLTAWYSASIDVVGKHFSGLLLVKNMPDHSKRILFINEAGVTFFDFEYSADKSFRVHHIIKPLNRKPVIKTLSKDFALIVREPFQEHPESAFKNEKGQIVFAHKLKKETAYWITNKDCRSFERLEIGSGRNRKSTVFYYGENTQVPDSILLTHHTFNMNITLRKMTREHVVE